MRVLDAGATVPLKVCLGPCEQKTKIVRRGNDPREVREVWQPDTPRSSTEPRWEPSNARDVDRQENPAQ